MEIVCQQLRFAYPGTRRDTLAGVDCRFLPGKVTAIVGANATGKTTLLRLLAGALRPTNGRVRPEVSTMDDRRRAGRVAYIAQQPALDGAFTLEQYVSLGRHARPARPRAVRDAIERVGLAGVAGQAFGHLSVGQRQLASLARAIAQLDGDDVEPGDQVLLADEPAAALDPGHAIAAFGLLRESARSGRGVVAVVHDVAIASRFADHAVLLGGSDRDGGAVVLASGETSRVLTPENLRRAFGVRFAYVRALAAVPPETATPLEPKAHAGYDPMQDTPRA